MVWVELFCTLTHDTESAVLFEDGGDKYWIPKSKLGMITYAETGDSREIRREEDVEAFQIPQWLAEEKDLEWDV